MLPSFLSVDEAAALLGLDTLGVLELGMTLTADGIPREEVQALLSRSPHG